MFKNYLKVAFRNLLKRKVFSLINVMGLAIGMAVCLLIILFIQGEMGYDSFQKNIDQIYRLVLERKYPGRSTSYAIIPQSIGDAVKHEFPEVKESTRMFDIDGNDGNFPFTIGDKVFEERNVYAVDSNFFRVFSYQAIAGNPLTALNNPHSAVITQTTAEKLYGSAGNAIGKTWQDVENNIKVSYAVTAVIKNWSAKSHMRFDMLVSGSSFPFLNQPNYTGFSALTYLLLDKNATQQSVENKLPLIVQKYVSGAIGKSFGENYEDFLRAGNGYYYYLQPLKQIHLTSDLEAEIQTNGSITTIYVFAIIAIFILSLACVNFINLSTSFSVERAKEVGIRKTFGSERGSIIRQFLLESVLISFLSLIVAFVLMVLFIPLFNQLSGKDLSITYFFTPLHIIVLLLFAFVVGLMAGIYPAFILSSFNPITVLKGRFKSNKHGLILRNGLVVFQFAISIILIIATITVNSQLGYMMGNKLGFKKDHVIIINNAFSLNKNINVFRDELLNMPGVSIVAKASTLPGNQNFFGITYQPVGSNKPVTGRGIQVDENYAKLLNLEMAKGRFFSKEFGSDTLGAVLNETAVAELGLKNPIGTRLTSPDQNTPGFPPTVFTVVGVVRDFYYQSLHQKINPLIFTYYLPNAAPNVLAVRVRSDDFQSVVNQIGHSWGTYVKDQPFHYSFLDQKVAEQYLNEQITQRLFTVFAVLAIFIACIGLMGLAAYSTQQRIREIGIRKVLGASVTGIISMLSVDFLKLILWAVLLAFPIAWWGVHHWLQNFAYRVTISWWIFALSGLLSVLIAMLTISFQAIKAAYINPVKNLRNE